MSKVIKRWKFIKDSLKSAHGDHKWEVGKWSKINEPLQLCQVGFHCSETILQARGYVSTLTCAQVEVKGKHLKHTDKEVWSEMRLTKVWNIPKEVWVEFAIFTAEQVIDIYEKQYPDDKRPRQAIEAAKVYLEDPSQESADAAYASAYGADAAACAADADAADAAACAADAAAYAASAAVRAAYAARAAIKKKLNKWLEDRLNKLPELEAVAK